MLNVFNVSNQRNPHAITDSESESKKVCSLFYTERDPKEYRDLASSSIIIMVSYVSLNGFEEFIKYTETINPNGPPVLFYFSGAKMPDGNSWCPDCVEAEPVVKSFLSESQRNIIFAYVDVGDRAYWKEKTCPFRTDPRTKLLVIPTIIKWKGVQRLEGSQCNKRELLQMLFEDDE